MNESSKNTKTLSTSALVALIAESSGYHKYEIADILEHLAICTTRLLRNDDKVKIDGIGTISRRDSKSREFKSSFNGQNYAVSTKISATLKPDIYLKNALNLPEEIYAELTKRTTPDPYEGF